MTLAQSPGNQVALWNRDGSRRQQDCSGLVTGRKACLAVASEAGGLFCSGLSCHAQKTPPLHRHLRLGRPAQQQHPLSFPGKPEHRNLSRLQDLHFCGARETCSKLMPTGLGEGSPHPKLLTVPSHPVLSPQV